MSYAPRFPDDQSPLEKLYERMSGAGFAHVIRTPDDQQKFPGMFLFNEMWRLDKPHVRAFIGLDMASQGQMVVRFENKPPVTWAQTLAQRLKNVFGDKAQAPQKSEVVLSMNDILLFDDALPFCDDVAYKHAAMAIHLNQNCPNFFIVPEKSDHKALTLEGMIEPPFASERLGHKVKTPEDVGDYISQIGKAAAQRLMKIVHVSVEMPCAGDEVMMHAYKKLPYLVSTKPEPVHMTMFTCHANYYIGKQVEALHAMKYPHVPMFMR